MCGIAAIIPIKKRDHFSDIKTMINMVKHRGPDGHGYYQNEKILLAHTRLAIIDNSKQATQPMTYQERYWVTFNGELYNYIELKKELASLGHFFNTGSDTEVFLIGYAEWGNDCWSKYNGMWSACIYDSLENKVTFSRDRFGEKPLYYYECASGLYFFSEIKQIIALKGTPAPNITTVAEYLLTGFLDHTDNTFFEEIHSLPPGTYREINLDDYTKKDFKYYDLRDNLQALRIQPNIAHIEELLEQSIDLRLRADVPLGVFLSGGLDSSVISAFVSNKLNALNCHWFHAHGKEKGSDESSWAKQVADSLKGKLTIVTPNIEDYFDSIKDLVLTQEQPFQSNSMMMGWKLYEKIKSLGIKVMLSGQSADEIFLGYERYYTQYAMQLHPLMRIYELINISKMTKLSFSQATKYALYFGNETIRNAVLNKRSVLSDKKLGQQTIERLSDCLYPNKNNLRELQVNEILSCQLPKLLRYEDRNSMRHSIETRLPYLDHRLVEAAISLQPNIKLRKGWTKFALRVIAEQYLPMQVAWRKDKIGYQAPEKKWQKSTREFTVESIRSSHILKQLTNTNDIIRRYDDIPYTQLNRIKSIALWERYIFTEKGLSQPFDI